MKNPKKVVNILSSLAITTLPLAIDNLNEKLKENAEKKERERIYANQKHNGMVKYASIVFSLVGMLLSIFAIKQLHYYLFCIGILSVIAYIITFLYCLEIINERKHNTYKIYFIIGDMLMIITATLLFF